MTVPFDYAAPTGKTIAIAVRVPARPGPREARSSSTRAGPARCRLRQARQTPSSAGRVRDDVDIVGFDPRGVARSAPPSGASTTRRWTPTGGEPTPDTRRRRSWLSTRLAPSGRPARSANPTSSATSRRSRSGRDMDVPSGPCARRSSAISACPTGPVGGDMRALSHPGRPNGPRRGRRPGPHLRGGRQGSGGRLRPGHRGVCRAASPRAKCPLGESVDAALTAIQDFLARVDATPLPVSGDPRVTELTEGLGLHGHYPVAMYDQTSWPCSRTRWVSALRGDGTALRAAGQLLRRPQRAARTRQHAPGHQRGELPRPVRHRRSRRHPRACRGVRAAAPPGASLAWARRSAKSTGPATGPRRSTHLAAP